MIEVLRRSTAADFSSLLRPEDIPHDDGQAEDRARRLLALYAACERDAGLAAAVVALCRRSFWAHLALLVWTHDERITRFSVKPFSPRPVYRDIADFLDERTIDGLWAHPINFWDKSRQLMATWFCIARLDWGAHGKPFGDFPIVSKTDDDAQKAMSRAATILDHYPAFYQRAMGLRDRPRPSARIIRYPNGARLQSLPQRGGDALRSLVLTQWFFDEAAFQGDFARNYKAARGTAFDGRTQGIILSTPQLSEFSKYTLEGLHGQGGGTRKYYIQMRGFFIRRTERMKIDHIQTHFSVYPERRTSEWIEGSKAGMQIHDWEQEHNLSYTARGGTPIFPQLDRGVHLMNTQPRLRWVDDRESGRAVCFIEIPGYRSEATGEALLRKVKLLRAIDHGTNGFCGTVWVAVDDEFDWFVYRARKRSGWGVSANAMEIAELSEGERYEVDVIDAMDRLPDGGGQVIDLYANFQMPDGRRPLQGVTKCSKGIGSRQKGLNAVGDMLLATLSACAPDSAHWDAAGYSAKHRESFLEYSSLYIAPDAMCLFDELDQARYDERPDSDPMMNQPETSTDMADDALDCLRYLTDSGAHLMRNRKSSVVSR